mmetsp:Transcript_46207/g.105403  ORF Transcript_46207/g.105403 Transcript_46207/m.105403 type:complete len:276 (-) Transcript_46207:51-878(-)
MLHLRTLQTAEDAIAAVKSSSNRRMADAARDAAEAAPVRSWRQGQASALRSFYADLEAQQAQEARALQEARGAAAKAERSQPRRAPSTGSAHRVPKAPPAKPARRAVAAPTVFELLPLECLAPILGALQPEGVVRLEVCCRSHLNLGSAAERWGGGGRGTVLAQRLVVVKTMAVAAARACCNSGLHALKRLSGTDSFRCRLCASEVLARPLDPGSRRRAPPAGFTCCSDCRCGASACSLKMDHRGPHQCAQCTGAHKHRAQRAIRLLDRVEQGVS